MKTTNFFAPSTFKKRVRSGATFENLENRCMLTAIGFATHEVGVSSNANGPRVVIAADIDGDDDQDTVVASWGDRRIAWYENTDSQGSFGKHHIVTTAENYFPFSAAVADLDGDGDLDLVLTSHRGSRSPERIVTWHENLDGKGNFSGPRLLDASSSESEPGTQSIEIADVDRDGHLDILVVNTGGIFNNVNQSFEVAWLRNVDGHANFAERRALYSGEGELLSYDVADMDGDDDLDLLLVSRSASPEQAGAVRNITTKWVEHTVERGTFSNEQTLAMATTEDYYTSHVLAADMDNDGDIDAVSARRGFNAIDGATDELIWFDNLGDGSFADERIFAPHPAGNLQSIRDLNGDGLPDLISNDGRQIKWVPNLDGKGAVGDSAQMKTKHRGILNSLDTGDFDGDGDLDVVVALGNTDAIIWLENTDGNGTFGEGGQFSGQKSHATFLHVSDMDSDGDLDVFATFDNPDSGDSMAWYENIDGLGTFGEAQNIEHEGAWLGNVQRIDLDGDGHLDIAILNEWGVSWLRNLKDEGFSELEEFFLDRSEGSNYESYDFGDFDADGDVDILRSSRVNLTDEERELPEYSGVWEKTVIAWFENMSSQGGIEFASEAHFVREGPHVTAAVADVDRDGDADILTRQNSPVVQLGFHENLGAGVFADESAIDDQRTRRVGNVVMTDIDGDQDLDLLVTSQFNCFCGSRPQGDLVWYRNTDGTFGAAREIAPYRLDDFFTVDFDSDGDVDIVTSGSWGVGWHENDGNGQFLPREIIGHNLFPTQLADIDGDGDLDAVSTSQSAAFAWHENRIAGDTNGDGKFDSSDLVSVFQDNEYEDGIEGNSTFKTGDWNNDGEFDSSDLVFVFQAGNYLHAADPALFAAAIDALFDDTLPGQVNEIA